VSATVNPIGHRVRGQLCVSILMLVSSLSAVSPASAADPADTLTARSRSGG